MTSVQDLKREILAIQRKHVSERRLQNMRRLECFITAMENYGQVIEVFLNVSDILAFVWIVGSYSEAFTSLLDTYQLIGESLPMLDKCRGFLESSPYVRQALVSIYHDILDFHHQALRYFRRPLLNQIFRETWPNYKIKFSPIIDSLTRHKQLVEERITFTQLETVIAHSVKASEELERQRNADESTTHRAVQCWLNSADVQVDHESVSDVRSTNQAAGQWLLQNDVFRSWQSADTKDPLLWLSGIPGAGKSVLASLIIDQCRTFTSNTTIWFYCKHGDDQRNTLIALARALISQLLTHNMDLLPYIYSKMCSKGGTILSSETLAKQLMEMFLKSSAGLHIVIDGLDECGRQEEEKIIQYLRSTIESSGHSNQRSTKCVFVSQSDAIASKALRNIPNIDMKPHHNHDDIVAFVSSEGAGLRNKFRLSADILQQITRLVVEKAGGMFLFAKLVMASLSSQVSQQKLLQELHSKGIPNGLREAYSRVISVALDQGSRDEALQLLSWLVCAKRQLKWREVQGAVAIDLEINVQHEELKMATLCLGYLSLPGFYGALGDDSVTELLNHGYYAFLDYAVRYWTSHLKSGLTTGVNETSKISMINSLQEFLSMHYRSSGANIEVPEEIRQAFRLLQLSQWSNFEQFLQAFHATDEQARTFGESAALNHALDIPDVISRIRKFLEETQADSDSILASMTSSFYGVDLFKCPRLSCDFFHRGFRTSKQRDEHISKHNHSFGCSFPGCLRSTLGFPTQRELEKHIAQTHKSVQQENQIFPSKKARPALQCDKCEEYFYEPKKLLTHGCAMGTDHLQGKNGIVTKRKQEAGTRKVKAPSRNFTQSPDKSTTGGQEQKFNNSEEIQSTPSPESAAAKPQQGSVISWEELQNMTPQQQLKTLKDIGSQQAGFFRGRLPDRVTAENNWTANMPPQIDNISRDIVQNTLPADPLPMTLEQKTGMSQLFAHSLDVLARLDVLLVLIQTLNRKEDQGMIIKNLLTMRVQIMRQFKDTQSWDLNDCFTISHDYLIGAITFIRGLFGTMIPTLSLHDLSSDDIMNAINNGSELGQASSMAPPSINTEFPPDFHNPGFGSSGKTADFESFSPASDGSEQTPAHGHRRPSPGLLGNIDVPKQPTNDASVPPPAPPNWLVDRVKRLKKDYPNDSFEAVMRPSLAEFENLTAASVANPMTPGRKYLLTAQIQCHDCPGTLYSPGPGMTMGNFKAHLRQKHHREIVRARIPNVGSLAPT
ncbi:ankyrin repeat-containing protein [Penicillium herquei]|nr:ankyrin repeat-containing protein [Penicillium herquei]